MLQPQTSPPIIVELKDPPSELTGLSDVLLGSLGLAGILILLVPRLLNFIVAIYLIAIGVIGLLGHVKL